MYRLYDVAISLPRFVIGSVWKGVLPTYRRFRCFIMFFCECRAIFCFCRDDRKLRPSAWITACVASGVSGRDLPAARR